GALCGGTAIMPAIILGMVLVCGIWSDFLHSYVLDNIRFGSSSAPTETSVNAGHLLNNVCFAGDREFTWAEASRMLIELGGWFFGFNEFFLWLVAFGGCGLLFLPCFTQWDRLFAAFPTALLLVAVLAGLSPGLAFIPFLHILSFHDGVLDCM